MHKIINRLNVRQACCHGAEVTKYYRDLIVLGLLPPSMTLGGPAKFDFDYQWVKDMGPALSDFTKPEPSEHTRPPL